MAQEIERKFLVTDDSWRLGAVPIAIRQGYLAKQNGNTARVRTKGTKGFLTIKGPTTGLSREEFEYEIPFKDALELLELSLGPVIEKNRYHIDIGQHLWEVDEFGGENEGLVVAEIELGSEDEPFEKPLWLGKEVSHERRYYNSQLSLSPYRVWEE